MLPISPKVALVRDGGEIYYPETDGLPIADNTIQYEWITLIHGNLAIQYADHDDVFVAADHFWYPVEGRPDIVTAPDVYVVFGRPRGHRRSYQQWLEENIAPQVAFEILSPSNTAGEMKEKLAFYRRYGVEEYYVFDPDRITLTGYRRSGDQLKKVKGMDGYVSPRLGIRFDLSRGDLVIYSPAGQMFLSVLEIDDRRKRAEAARERAEQAQRLAEADALAARQRSDLLAAKLRALGIDPDA